MIVIATTLFGAIYGGWLSRKRGGNRADIAQFVAVYAMMFAVVGLFVTIMIHRGL